MVRGFGPSEDGFSLIEGDAGLLESDHPIFRAITDFATQYEFHRRDAAQLAELGRELRAEIERQLRPDPPDLDRKDIHG